MSALRIISKDIRLDNACRNDVCWYFYNVWWTALCFFMNYYKKIKIVFDKLIHISFNFCIIIGTDENNNIIYIYYQALWL